MVREKNNSNKTCAKEHLCRFSHTSHECVCPEWKPFKLKKRKMWSQIGNGERLIIDKRDYVVFEGV